MASVIPKQLKKERDQITIKLDRDVLQNLEHYCRYLESSRAYVINQCLAFIFRKDRAFSDWLVGRPRNRCDSGIERNRVGGNFWKNSTTQAQINRGARTAADLGMR